MLNEVIVKASSIMRQRGHGLLNHAFQVANLVDRVLTFKPSLVSGYGKNNIVLAALLHDLGKVRWPDKYFTADAKSLSSFDQATMKLHPIEGANEAIKIGAPDTVATLIAQHHERPNSQGYPNRIRPHHAALLISVCDVFSACIEPRAYRAKCLTQEEALLAAQVVGFPEAVEALRYCLMRTHKISV